MNLLITGAASGIGYAAAKRMAPTMDIIVADLHLDRAQAVADELGRDGHRAFAVGVDVSRAESVSRMKEWIDRHAGPVHALFNNAGINRRHPVADIGEDEWDLMMATHVKGTYLCAQAVLPGMCRQGKGVIVNMSSDFAVMGMPGGSAYAAAKSAVYSLTKSLALEFAPYGVRVNALGPGPIDTPLLRSGRSEQEWDEAEARFRQNLPMGRLGRPEEVASVLEFMLSDRSAYMTGQIVHPNGGQLVW